MRDCLWTQRDAHAYVASWLPSLPELQRTTFFVHMVTWSHGTSAKTVLLCSQPCASKQSWGASRNIQKGSEGDVISLLSLVGYRKYRKFIRTASPKLRAITSENPSRISLSENSMQQPGRTICCRANFAKTPASNSRFKFVCWLSQHALMLRSKNWGKTIFLSISREGQFVAWPDARQTSQ